MKIDDRLLENQPTRYKDQKGRLRVHEVEENDGVTERPPNDGPGAEPHHVASLAPEADVVLEGEKIKEEVHGGHSECDEEQDKVGVSKDPFHLVCVLLGEAHAVHRAEGASELEEKP